MIKVLEPIFYFLSGALTTAILDRFVWPGLLDKLETLIFGPRRIVLNIARFDPLKIDTDINLENFILAFATAEGQAWIVAIKKGHDDLRKEFGLVFFPAILSIQLGTVDFSITLKNTGRRSLRDVRVKLLGPNEIKYDERSLRHIDFKHCGGLADNYFCEIRINKLRTNSIAGLVVRAGLPAGLREVECDTSGNSRI